MRTAPLLAALLLALPVVGHVSPARAETGSGALPKRGAHADVDRARDLDAFGAKAFREGNYRDAALFFSEAYRLGAPAIELWNMARCHERLDEVDTEARLLEAFVASPDAREADRVEAQRVLEAIGRRPSVLVVDPGPRGGAVLVDERPIATTTTSPVVLHIAPGPHQVRVEREDGSASSVAIEARRGRAISVHPSDADDDRLIEAGHDDTSVRRASAALELGAFLPRLGSHTAPIAPAASLALRYALVVRRRTDLNVGLRFAWTQDRWASGSEATPTMTGCALERDFVASDLSAFVTVGGGYHFGRRVRAGLELGFGFDTLVASQAGGELFDPSCDPSFGYRPAAHAGLDLSYEVVRGLRIVVSPAIFDLHPAFGGARGEATSVWYRAGAALGLAVDL